MLHLACFGLTKASLWGQGQWGLFHTGRKRGGQGVTLEFELDQFHGNGELMDVHTAIAVHVSQSPLKGERLKTKTKKCCEWG